MEMLWIKCTDQLPKTEGLKIIYAPTMDINIPLITLAWWNKKQSTWDGIPICFSDAVSHWMELPEKPI